MNRCNALTQKMTKCRNHVAKRGKHCYLHSNKNNKHSQSGG